MPGRRSDPGVLADMETAISTVPRPGLVELPYLTQAEDPEEPAPAAIGADS